MADNGTLVQLRLRLRHATSESHAALDSIVEPTRLSESPVYAEFLQAQYRARRPVEAWVAKHCSAEFAPPPVTDLIVADLRDMDASIPAQIPAFSLPGRAHPLGLAWAIAGSHLGNRMILKQLRDAASELPTQFLEDDAMKAFWRKLAPLLDEPVTAERAAGPATAAETVFAHFSKTFSEDMRERAA